MQSAGCLVTFACMQPMVQKQAGVPGPLQLCASARCGWLPLAAGAVFKVRPLSVLVLLLRSLELAAVLQRLLGLAGILSAANVAVSGAGEAGRGVQLCCLCISLRCTA